MNPALRLWPLALLAALLPLAGTALAFTLSVRLGLIPECNPFLDGCVSISRAGRHGLPNLLFRALLLPAAVLQAICWLLCPGWLRQLGAPPDRWQRALPLLGLGAGTCLVLYGSFLGSDGEGYRFLRRYGTALYFGLTCIGMLVVGGEMARRPAAAPRSVGRALLALCAALPLLGLVHVAGALLLPEPAARDALENVTEWWGGALFTTFFLALAWAWRRTGYVARLGSEPPG
ncbi:MAG: hypothetical protein KF788_07375 [Piscinibacter sp.]|nr:hypothetical protein [Piscinibacter sp.]